MEHAIWMKESGEEEYVSVRRVKNDLGAAKAREQKYRCPSKKCGVAMIPVFPAEKRVDGKEAHSDHFRAHPKRHEDSCGGDGQREGTSGPGGAETGAKPRHRVVRRGGYPVRLDRRRRARRAGAKGPTGDGAAGPGRKRGTAGRGGESRGGSHTSKPGAGHIRRLVEAYENPPEDRSQMEILIPGCPARNYADAFVDVGRAVDQRGIIGGYYIYVGPYGRHHTYPSGGIAVGFDHTSGDGKNLGVWIGPSLGPEASREEVLGLLARAARDKNATVYVLGRFRPFGDRKYSVDIEAFGDLWITFPASPDPAA